MRYGLVARPSENNAKELIAIHPRGGFDRVAGTSGNYFLLI
jgi:hypothetical protein